MKKLNKTGCTPAKRVSREQILASLTCPPLPRSYPGWNKAGFGCARMNCGNGRMPLIGSENRLSRGSPTVQEDKVGKETTIPPGAQQQKLKMRIDELRECLKQWKKILARAKRKQKDVRYSQQVKPFYSDKLAGASKKRANQTGSIVYRRIVHRRIV